MTKLDDLRGSSRRTFLRWTTAAGAALALDRARVLDVIAGSGGSAMADEACSATCRSIHLVGGNGGLAWFQLLWPHVAIARAADPAFAFHAPGEAVEAVDTDRPFLFAPESPWQRRDATKRITALMAGVNQTHTSTPAAQIGSGESMLAVVAAIQRATPSLIPVIGVSPVAYGAAHGAPPVATVGDALGIVELFNSVASRLTLELAGDAAAFEAYYAALATLSGAAGRPTWARALHTGKAGAGLLGKNLAAQLAPTGDDLARYGIDEGTPQNLGELGRALIVAARAFKLGLTQSVIVPAMRDDPHGAFQDMRRLRSTVAAIGRVLDAFLDDLAAEPDPQCAGRTLADTTILTVHGDTPKSPTERSGWPDRTPRNANWMYVLGNGYLRTGWFGGAGVDGRVSGFDPATGADVPDQPSSATGEAAGAAVAFAVAKGDMRRVLDFYRGPSLSGVVVGGGAM